MIFDMVHLVSVCRDLKFMIFDMVHLVSVFLVCFTCRNLWNVVLDMAKGCIDKRSVMQRANDMAPLAEKVVKALQEYTPMQGHDQMIAELKASSQFSGVLTVLKDATEPEAAQKLAELEDLNGKIVSLAVEKLDVASTLETFFSTVWNECLTLSCKPLQLPNGAEVDIMTVLGMLEVRGMVGLFY